ncbi:MAG TPA: hypothetical protein VER83_04585 [Candidatus Nanopelagicales bacterium]|nr:hypothetical protein [Candidatus Nanopelagicales bacterium]
MAPSAGHRDAYRRRFRRVRRAFVTEDPVFLIEAGGRTDEYDAIVRRVLGLVDAERGAEVATLLPAELEQRFGVTPDAGRLARLVGELARIEPYRA